MVFSGCYLASSRVSIIERGIQQHPHPVGKQFPSGEGNEDQDRTAAIEID
jgi:hypothetical protein